MVDRTLPPTARRLQQARESGDVPVSRVARAAGATAASLLTLESLARSLEARFDEGLARALEGSHEPARAARHLIEGVALTAAPVVAAMAVVALGLTFAQTGGLIRFGPHRRSGPGGVLSLAALAGSLGALAVGATALWLATLALRDHVDAASSARGAALGPIVAAALDVAWKAVFALGAWAVLDVLLTRATWRAGLRMTVAERRQEERDIYGDPGIRRARSEARLSARATATRPPDRRDRLPD